MKGLFMIRKKLLLLCVALVFALLHLPNTERIQADTGECPVFVKDAMQETLLQCARTPRNRICYGNSDAQLEAKAGFTNIRFQKPGDTVRVEQVSSLSLAALNAETQAWGMAVMRVQANLPDTATNEYVTIVLFGDVQLSEGSARIPGAKPMQAFYFKSSGKTPCKEAPRDGILIQTPKGRQQIELWVNGANIKMGSTVFFETRVDGELNINTLEGEAVVTAGGVSRVALPGQRVWVPMTANMDVAGPARSARAYNANVVANLPLSLLPRAITVATPSVPTPKFDSVAPDGTVSLNGEVEAVITGSPNVLIVSSIGFLVEDASLLEGVQFEDQVLVTGAYKDGVLYATTITNFNQR
jgi:hypothetical protein